MNGKKALAAIVAAGVLMMPAVSQAGRRATVPVGLHIAPMAAPMAAIASQAGVAMKRKSLKVVPSQNLIGFGLIGVLGAMVEPARVRRSASFVSRGAA